MPSERCPTCPFNDLCTEEKQCPIERESFTKTVGMKELRQFAKIKHLKTEEQTENQIEAFHEARGRFEKKSDFY